MYIRINLVYFFFNAEINYAEICRVSKECFGVALDIIYLLNHCQQQFLIIHCQFLGILHRANWPL